MNSTPTKLEFQKNGHFYIMVTTYTTAIGGLLLYHPFYRAKLDEHNIQKNSKLISIGSREYPSLEVKPHENIELIDKGLITLGGVTDSLVYMLINIAYESVKDLLDKHNPIYEFFRHLRHGASHGGKWSFRDNEPLRLAEWRGRKVTSNLQGKKLWDLNLGPGDIIVLLWDIEQNLP